MSDRPNARDFLPRTTDPRRWPNAWNRALNADAGEHPRTFWDFARTYMRLRDTDLVDAAATVLRAHLAEGLSTASRDLVINVTDAAIDEQDRRDAQR